MTYRAAGVDVAAGEGFVRRISEAVRATHRAHPGRVLAGGGDFAGLFRLGGGYRDPVLVSGTDGVGTKLLVAQEVGRHDTVGIDLVAMCVNDVLTAGAAPLFFLDYIATGALEGETLAAIVGGVAEGCRRASCALLGGETAEMPGAYAPGAYDLAGFAVGVAEADALLGPSRVRAGDVLLGLSSSGLHSNGYSLVRKVFPDPDEWRSASPHPDLGRPLGEVLLEPTRIYAPAAEALRGRPGVRAVAHVTGGGLPGNVSRILPPGLQARLRPDAWPVPAIFGLLERRGPIGRAEMFRTFNMGLGLVACVAREGAEAAAGALAAAGEAVHRVGEVGERPEGAPAVAIEGVGG